MKAIRIHRQDGAQRLVYEDVPQPQPADGEVLVQVYATSVTPAELGWGATWKTNAGVDRRFPIPGDELSGVVAQIGAKVADLQRVSRMSFTMPMWCLTRSGWVMHSIAPGAYLQRRADRLNHSKVRRKGDSPEMLAQ